MLRVENNNNNNNAQKEDFEVLYGVTEWHWSESYLSNFKTIHKKFNFKEHLRVWVRIEWFCIRRLKIPLLEGLHTQDGLRTPSVGKSEHVTSGVGLASNWLRVGSEFSRTMKEPSKLNLRQSRTKNETELKTLLPTPGKPSLYHSLPLTITCNTLQRKRSDRSDRGN